MKGQDQLLVMLELSRFRYHELDQIHEVTKEMMNKTVQLALEQGVVASSVSPSRARAALVKSHLHVGRAVRVIKDATYHPPREHSSTATSLSHKMKPVLRLYARGTDGSDFQILIALPDKQKQFALSRLLVGCGCVESWEGDTIIEGEAKWHDEAGVGDSGATDLGDIVIAQKIQRRGSSHPAESDASTTLTVQASASGGSREACCMCVPCMYALYVCLICGIAGVKEHRYFLKQVCALCVCLTCIPYVYALCVCLTCMPYMYALYVCLS